MPKYSIIVPVRNANAYIGHAVSSALSSTFDDFELILSDNHSATPVRESLTEEQLADVRLRLVTPEVPLSMTDNFNFAVGCALGEWLLVMGADDALMPWFFEAADALTAGDGKVDAYVWNRAYYFWPGCSSLYGDSMIYVEASQARTWVDSKREARRIMKFGGAYMDSVQLYTNSLVRRSVIESISAGNINGKFYQGSQPDIYSTFAILSEIPGYVDCDYPLTWIGTSPVSNGFLHASDADHERKIDFWSLNAEDPKHDSQLNHGPETPIPLFVLNAACLVPSNRLDKSDRLKLRRRHEVALIGAAVSACATEFERKIILESGRRMGISEARIAFARIVFWVRCSPWFRFQRRVTRAYKLRRGSRSVFHLDRTAENNVEDISQASRLITDEIRANVVLSQRGLFT